MERGGSGVRTLVAKKLIGYLSLGYIVITQDEDGSRFFQRTNSTLSSWSKYENTCFALTIAVGIYAYASGT